MSWRLDGASVRCALLAHRCGRPWKISLDCAMPSACLPRWGSRPRSSNRSPTLSATSFPAMPVPMGHSPAPRPPPTLASVEPLSSASWHDCRSRGRCVSGEFRPGGAGQEWCDADVLRRIRRRSLAKLRKEVEPVGDQDLRAVPAQHGKNVGGSLRGVDGLLEVIEQLQGVADSAFCTGELGSSRAGTRLLAGDARRSAGQRDGPLGWPRSTTRQRRLGVSRRRRSRHRPSLLRGRSAEATDTHAALLATLGVDTGLFFRTLTERIPAIHPCERCCGTSCGTVSSPTTPSLRCAPTSARAPASTQHSPSIALGASSDQPRQP